MNSTDEILRIYNDRIELLKNEKGLTFRGVADDVGLSISTMRKTKKHEPIPNGYSLLVLADYFDVSIDYLLGRTDERGIK